MLVRSQNSSNARMDRLAVLRGSDTETLIGAHWYEPVGKPCVILQSVLPVVIRRWLTWQVQQELDHAKGQVK